MKLKKEGNLNRLVPFKSLKFASQAFANHNPKFRRKQEYRSFFYALFNPVFSKRWFHILETTLKWVIPFRPRLYFKPYRVYMSTQWSKRQRVKVILDTYRFIEKKGETFKQAISSLAEVEIARFPLNEEFEGILSLGYDEKYRKEGEFVLFFSCQKLGGMIICAAISFEELESHQWACRIGCIQGNPEGVGSNTIKFVQKQMQALRPNAFIVFVAQEFARHIGCDVIYGAGNEIQAFRKKHAIHLPWVHNIKFDYDVIFEECGGEKNNEGWYNLPLIPKRKSYSEIKTHKRALYARRYAILDDLSFQIQKSAETLSGMQ